MQTAEQVLMEWLAQRFGAVAVEAMENGRRNFHGSTGPHNYDLRRLTRLKTLRILARGA